MNFYHWFIHSFSDIACPLFNVSNNNTACTWRPEKEYTFTSLKTAITTALVFTFLDTSILFRVKANSSDFATRAVLSQQSKKDDK